MRLAPTILQPTFCRVYFNRNEHPSKAWSVDFGAGTIEICCAAVVFDEVNGLARFEPAAGDASGAGGQDGVNPRAWIEIHRGTVSLDPHANTVGIRGGCAVWYSQDPFLKAGNQPKNTL